MTPKNILHKNVKPEKNPMQTGIKTRMEKILRIILSCLRFFRVSFCMTCIVLLIRNVSSMYCVLVTLLIKVLHVEHSSFGKATIFKYNVEINMPLQQIKKRVDRIWTKTKKEIVKLSHYP